MQQNINATTPTALLASSWAFVASQVAGYKEGFAAESAHEYLHNLFDADQGTPEWQYAFDTLRSIWDRAEGASLIVDKLGSDLTPEVVIDLDEHAIYMNGVDTRQDLADANVSNIKLMTDGLAVLDKATQVIQDLRGERDMYQGMVKGIIDGEQEPGGSMSYDVPAEETPDTDPRTVLPGEGLIDYLKRMSGVSVSIDREAA